MSRQAEVRKSLQAEVDRTRKAYQQATHDLNGMLEGAPSGMLRADGMTHISRTGDNFSTALHEYMAAIKALSDFILKGTEPAPKDGDRKRPRHTLD